MNEQEVADEEAADKAGVGETEDGVVGADEAASEAEAMAMAMAEAEAMAMEDE